MAVQLPLTLIIAGVLYFWGEASAERAHRFGHRLAGERGERAMSLAGRAIRAVALGVVLTALAQSVLGGIALWIAGVPFAGILTSVMFMLALAQIGAVPVLLLAAGWLYWKGSIGWMVAIIVWSVIVGSLDNIMRPLLIRQGADLSLLLIFAGVIGGLIAFGLVGIFVGPVVLAVAYTLLDTWLREEPGASGSGP
jgi:predicted PurR-regulated permease PerM